MSVKDMDDRDILIRCTKEMRLPIATAKTWARFDPTDKAVWIHMDKEFDGSVYEYNPFKNPKQLVALMKRFELDIRCYGGRNKQWIVSTLVVIRTDDEAYTKSSLERAVIECVANLQHRRNIGK